MTEKIDPSQVNWDQDQTATAPQPAQPGQINPEHVVWDEDKYGTPGQMALTGLEGGAQGFLGPIATGAEELLSRAGVPGISAPERRARAETNPELFGGSEAATMLGGALTGTGEAALLEGIGKGASNLVTKGAELSRMRAAGAGALRGGLEMLGFSSGDEISNAINQDPGQTAGSIVAHVGLSSLLGAAGGGLFGAVLPKWLEEHEEPVGQAIQDFKNSGSGSVADAASEAPAADLVGSGVFDSLGRVKAGSGEIADIGQRNNWPILEGMLSDSKEVQMAEDALLNGPPTLASVQRRELYRGASRAVDASLDQATNAGGKMSETQAGNAIKESLLGKLNDQYAPIKNVYSEIEPYRQAIPISDRSTGSLGRTIGSIIEEQGLVPGSERYNFIKTFADGIGNVDNLQKLANFRTEVSRSSGPLTKDLAQAISQKLNGVEDRAIRRYADTMKTGIAKDKIIDLLDKSAQAKSQYAAFRDNLQELGNSLGKKKIYGPQNFMDFIEDINPQTLARRSFNENNTEFASYLAKNFPEEMGIIRNYQRGVIREGATKEGLLNSKKLTQNVLGLEPEMRKLLYSAPEIQTVSDASKYLASFPKSFNPSGTAHESAFRAFFEHPTGAAIANLRDFGIQAFIKAAGRAAPGAEKEGGRLMSILGPRVMSAEPSPKGFKSSVQGALSAIKGFKTIRGMSEAVFAGSMPAISGITTDKSDKLDQQLKNLQTNPSKLFDTSGNMGDYMPDHAQALSQTAMTAVNYLNAQRPSNPKQSPLDTDIPVSKAQNATYKRTLGLAEQPVAAFQHIKNGTLLQQDVSMIKTLYPGFYNRASQELINAMSDHTASGGTVPYKIRQSMSLFLGQPMDSTMTPQSIQSIQGVYANRAQAPQPQSNSSGKKKGSPSKLGKISNNLRTPDQARMDRASQG